MLYLACFKGQKSLQSEVSRIKEGCAVHTQTSLNFPKRFWKLPSYLAAGPVPSLITLTAADVNPHTKSRLTIDLDNTQARNIMPIVIAKSPIIPDKISSLKSLSENSCEMPFLGQTASGRV